MTTTLIYDRRRKDQRPVITRIGVATSAAGARGRPARGVKHGCLAGVRVGCTCRFRSAVSGVGRSVGPRGSRLAIRRGLTESGSGRARSTVRPRSAAMASPIKREQHKRAMVARSSRMAISSTARPSRRRVCRILMAVIGRAIRR